MSMTSPYSFQFMSVWTFIESLCRSQLPIKDALFTLNMWKMVSFLRGLLITGLLITLEQ